MGIDKLKLQDDAPHSLIFSGELFIRWFYRHSF